MSARLADSDHDHHDHTTTNIASGSASTSTSMAHRSKRARSENGSNSRDLGSHGEMSDVNQRLQRPKPHETLWFDDGSIVLATDVHLYRVHKSMLAKYSSVFKDMLEMPIGGGEHGNSGGGVDADSWDGLPLVRLVGDSDENVYHLLMMLYDCDFYDVHKPTTLPIITSLLLMSTKYDIPSVRTQVIKRLENYYPNEIVKVFEILAEALFDEDVPDDCDFQLLAVAHKCNILRLLPMLFYKCAARSLRTILKYSDNLEKEILHKILIGREYMLQLSNDFGALLLFPNVKCDSTNCMDTRRAMIEVWGRSSDEYPRLLPIEVIVVGLRLMGAKGNEGNLNCCAGCREKSASARSKFKEDFWEDLPNIFGLDSWNDVLNGY
ncbi:hypothetical protein SCHPADRAFT_945787 [Schizopora paradoxa]|uniref:BTB domain-containing protein n=1 Tax=Schizopora paradoxa TaxID=27342 RepID=A0A0H2R4Q5_9AGAM|nr:hypothetical protein SCHPADRAFT_945787 [Schizopora paradoxa]